MFPRLFFSSFLLVFVFLSFSTFSSAQKDERASERENPEEENPCLLNGIDYSGLSSIPDLSVTGVSNCQTEGFDNFLFSLCRPLRNQLGRTLKASAVQIFSGGEEEIMGIFPAYTVTTPMYGGNISQGITIKASTAAGSNGPELFINLYCWYLAQSETNTGLPLLNPWLTGQVWQPQLSVNAQGQCNALQVSLFSDCVCPGYGENPLKPCSPPVRPSNISMSFPNLYGLFAYSGQKGEMISLSSISFSHLIPNAFDPINKIPTNYTVLNFPLNLQPLAPKGILFTSFLDNNLDSREIYFIMETMITSTTTNSNSNRNSNSNSNSNRINNTAGTIIQYDFYHLNIDSMEKDNKENSQPPIGLLFSIQQTEGEIYNCQSLRNMDSNSPTKTIICLENGIQLNSPLRLIEYSYSIGNSTDVKKIIWNFPNIVNFNTFLINQDGTRLYVITDTNISCYDAQAKKFLWEIPMASQIQTLGMSLAVDSSQGNDRLFILSTGTYPIKNFQEIIYQIYEVVGKEVILVNTIPDVPQSPNPWPAIILDSYGIQWCFVNGALLRLNPSYAPQKDSLAEI